MSRRYDIAIIGAGVMGASCALFLARGGMRVALLDRRGICAEASGANAGTLTLHMTRAALIPYALKGWQMWTQCNDWLGGDPGVTEAPGLSLAFTDSEMELLQKRATARRNMGADITLLTPKEAQAVEPGLSAQLRLAAYCPIDGHVTANFTGQVYRQALISAGVSLFESCPVNSIAVDTDCYSLGWGENRAQSLTAKRLVMATGTWLEPTLALLGIDLPITNLANQLIVTERTAPIMRSVISIANGLLSLKQFANGTVLIGGGWQGRADRQTGATELIPANLIGNTQLARYVIPALSNTRIVRAWVGFEAETADAMPLVGALPGFANAYVIGSVHSGYTSGPYMGKLLARHILGRENALPLFDPGRLLEPGNQRAQLPTGASE